MNTSRITEAYSDATKQPDLGESVIDQLYDRFASSLAHLAQENVGAFLTTQGTQGIIAEDERTVLYIVAGHEFLEALGTALRLAPQGLMTQDLYPTIVRHQSEFTQAANEMFPEDPNEERQLAELVRALRASLRPTPRR